MVLQPSLPSSLCEPLSDYQPNTKETKLAAQPICKNPECTNKIGLELSLYCSRKCKDKAERLRDYSAEVSLAINKFFVKHNRIPLKEEMMGIYYRSRKSFKTWNNAVFAAGFDPIKTRFAKNWTAQDGHTCNSLIEKILDDWLTRHHINHQSHVHYPWGGLMTADFKVNEYWIELFGLKGQFAKYDEYRHRKMSLIRKYHLKLISLTTKDVLNSVKLKTKLAPILMC